ncbi:endo-beta-N-acetylglucosaminidase [Actinoplanes sp. ATCC 53533]|uniref:endo-beta-N-acetylglucosaminidase n=1 Tax=Actinoplanes sp. ATCC 53533 TaxID=1288362 RepID=UPI000F77F91B|nr:endo-beta-N-acetylglucosaminidase [Actinoplanes sp. ATCC 53533]RSM56532.1 endo-beta-N-acetylglucosaminidase [Actinoplanes sp. ATCC 53533]
MRVLRRRSVTTLAAVATLVAALAAVPARASDTLPWTGAAAKGANQPFQHGYTSADLLRWAPGSDLFGDLTRSRVPLQPRVAPLKETQADPGLDPAVQMLTLAGDYGNAFFESYPYNNEFSAYLFNYWQYTDFYAPWHGMATEGVPERFYDPTLDWREKWFEFGMLNLPNPGYTNAAHRNGVKSLACIFFSENDRGTQTYSELLVQDANGDFPVARKLVELARWYGFDGYFLNQEEPSVAVADIPRYKAFLKVLRDSGMYVQFYDAVDNNTGARSYQNAFNSVNAPWVRDPKLGDVSDSMFLNYWWSKSRLTSSRDYARSIGLDPRKTVFAGVEAGGYQFNQPYNLQDNLDSAGVPMNGIATLGADFVHSDMAGKEDDANQWKAYERERRWWTGSSTGGADDAPNWKGISAYITERSAAGGTVFDTTFNTGHGLEYVANGTVSNPAEWSNINIQDYPVTWQWSVAAAGGATPLGVDYDYGTRSTKPDRFSYQQVGAYQGGSSLVLTGDLAADNYLRLYRTDLAVTDKSKLAVTYRKVSASDASQLRAAITFADAPGAVVQVPVAGSGAQGGWTEATLDLSGYAGRRIVTLGLSAAAGPATVAGYQLNVGRITLTDGASHRPAKPTGFHLRAALTGTDELELGWNLDGYDNVAQYAVYDNGGYLGGSYDDVLYVKRFTSTKGTLQLRAIGHDGSVSEPATIAYDFGKAPGDVTATAAADGNVTVKWPQPVPANTRVKVTSQYRDQKIVKETTVTAGATSAVLSGLPTTGGHYLVTVCAGGTPVAYRGEFADRQVEPYPAALVKITGNTFRFATPTTPDWYKLYVKEDGVAKTFATTYSSGAKPYIIRGRTTLTALTVGMARSTSEVTVTIEDYSGNTATTVVRRAATG